MGHAEVADVGTDHVDVAVGEVDELDDAVDHGVAQGHQRINAAQRHAVDQLLKENFQNNPSFLKGVRGPGLRRPCGTASGCKGASGCGPPSFL